ncbi:hydroxymethylglutaryl-CoA lyase [Thermodesulfobacteriota bacterium]
MQDLDSQTSILLEDEALRDGLQIESQLFTVAQKIELFKLLKSAGVRRIQVGSFVHPKIVPQMAATDELIKALGKQHDTVISALILNDKGLERALACSVPHVSMSVSVSDTHSRKNARKSAADALDSMVDLIKNARNQGLEVRAGLQSAFGCVYEGSICESAVLAAAERMMSAGVDEINLADSTGMANPLTIRSLVQKVSERFPETRISLHLHDTRGLGLANMFSGYEAGVRIFDVCAGGLGGCPFIKGAAGNVPTEDAVHMFESMGIATGIDLKTLMGAVDFLEQALERPLPGRMKKVSSSEPICNS